MINIPEINLGMIALAEIVFLKVCLLLVEKV